MLRKNWLLVVTVYVLVLGLSLYGLILRRQPRTAEPPLADSLQLVYTLGFRCGHEITLAPADGLRGVLSILNLDEKAIVWEQATVDASVAGVIQKGTVDYLCRECQTYMFVGVKDGYVAVFYGMPHAGAELKMLTDIPLARLPLEMQAQLNQGILIRSESDLQRFLEGIDR